MIGLSGDFRSNCREGYGNASFEVGGLPDDDPNEHLSYEEGIAWMRRFDRDSSWPEGKRINKVNGLSLEEDALKVKGGEPCLRNGYWKTPAQPDSRQYFKQVEILPAFAELDWGEVYWYWDGE